MVGTFIDFLVEDNRKHPVIRRPKNNIVSPKKPKPRPSTNLWFNTSKDWYSDLHREKGDDLDFYEDENGNIYSTDKAGEYCFGYWDKQRRGGMTFVNAKPFRHFQHRKTMDSITA